MSKIPPDGILSGSTYTTGTGYKISKVHKEDSGCKKYGCVIHAPSNHHMRKFPTHFRGDNGVMERMCPCGVGHPDPDHINFVHRQFGLDEASAVSMHGCCGCCDKSKHRNEKIESVLTMDQNPPV